jgi:hypothetical protein
MLRKRILQSAALSLLLMLPFVVVGFVADTLNLPMLLALVVYWVCLFPTELFKLVLPAWSEQASFETRRNLSLIISFLSSTALFYIILSWRARRRGTP